MKKTLTITISSCSYCPNYDRNWDRCLEADKAVDWIVDYYGDVKIPEWCPLEDYKEKVT